MPVKRFGTHQGQRVAEMEDGSIVPVIKTGNHQGRKVAQLATGEVAVMEEKGGFDWVEFATEGGAMALGGLMLSPLGPGGVVAGAGLGYAAAREATKARKGKGTPLRKIPEYAVKEMPKETLKGMGYEATGIGVSKVVGKVAAPVAKKITPKLKAAGDYFVEAGKRLMPEGLGKTLTPAQATHVRALDLIENVVENSLLGGGRYRKFREGQKELISRIAAEVAEKVGPEATEHEIGILVQDALQSQADSFYAAARGMYAQVDKAAGGTRLFTKAIKNRAAKLAETVGLTDKPTTALLKQITDMNDKVSFKQLQQMRSDLLSVGYKKVEGELVPGRHARFARKFAKEIDLLFASKRGLNAETQKTLKAANAFFKEGKQEFGYKLLRSLTLNEPEKVMRRVFAKGAVEPIRRLKKIVGPEIFAKMRGYHARKLLFEDAWDVTTDRVVGTRLEASMKRLGKDTMKEIYGANYTKEWSKFINTVKTIQRKPSGLGGGMLIQLTQAGAIIAMFTLDDPGKGAATILLGPAAMAQILTRPAGIRWLTRGLTVKAGTKEAVKIATRLTLLAGEQLLEQEQQSAPEFGIGP